MARGGDLGTFAQEQIALVDALPFDVEFRSGDIKEEEAGEHLAGEATLSRRPDNGEVVSATVTVDIRRIEGTGRNVPTTSVHEFNHVIEGSKRKKPISEPEKPRYENSAKEAERKFRKSFKGNNQFFRTIRQYNKKVQDKKDALKREEP